MKAWVDRHFTLVFFLAIAALIGASLAAHYIRDGRGLNGHELFVLYIAWMSCWAARVGYNIWREYRG